MLCLEVVTAFWSDMALPNLNLMGNLWREIKYGDGKEVFQSQI